MPPRRREIPMLDPTVELEMRELHAILDAMEIATETDISMLEMSLKLKEKMRLELRKKSQSKTL
jgi:hypothetical protein